MEFAARFRCIISSRFSCCLNLFLIVFQVGSAAFMLLSMEETSGSAPLLVGEDAQLIVLKKTYFFRTLTKLVLKSVIGAIFLARVTFIFLLPLDFVNGLQKKWMNFSSGTLFGEAGANKGIGYGICEQLAANKGIVVVLTARDEKRGIEALEKLKKDNGLSDEKVLFHKIDVADSSSVESLTQFITSQFGKLDILNGMLEPWFKSKALGDADQVLAYFAVAKLGEPPTDGKTDTNPEGLTAAYGKWASAIATRLVSGGLSCKVLEKDAFQKQMLEKLIWICAFMLVGARHPGATVGDVEKKYRSEVSSLISELASAAAKENEIIFEEAMEDRLCAYSRAVAHFPTAVKEFKWRNGWFYSLSEKAISEGKPDPCPLHTSWLKELKIV